MDGEEDEELDELDVLRRDRVRIALGEEDICILCLPLEVRLGIVSARVDR